MASGIGLSLDTSFLQSLEKVDDKIKELTNKTNALSRATVQAFQQMANGGVVPYIEQLERQKKALEEIGKIKGTSPFLTKMQADAKVAVDEINNLIKTLEKTKAYKDETSGKTAMSFANSVLGQKGQTKSIDNMKLAISQLEAAQNRLNLNTKTGQKNYEKIGETIKKVKAELDKATGANKQLTQESEKTKKSFNGLGGVISTVFSVTAIRGFLNNLIKVRGEFELQHKSLQVLLQDVDEANELWDKTIALAVKSPYRVKELVTYTKQLAAYRVESEKLYDTTRMLADVSAGLGVDMNRLILAFGQVKAANFLRGTELRQFSEAGVNLLEELSKRFTQLEGRAVSVGDVFERVSKRMVKFSDVEAVFQKITSEGGVFYQMQEKQSETLRGMIMNLKDSVDLMFNEMGRSQDSSLKGALRLVKELVDNWRKFIPVISSVGAAFLAGFSVKIIASIGAAFKALWAIIAANPIMAAVSLVTALAVAIMSAKRNVDELTASLNQVDVEVTKQLEESITLYRKLAEQVRDVTATQKDRNKALEQLKSHFDEILPDQLLEIEYIKGISDNYGEATEAMMNYYNAKATEQKKDRVESQFGESIDTEIVDLIQGTRKMITTWGEKGLIGERDKVALLSGVGGIIRSVSEGIKNGEIDDNFDDVRRAILQKLSEYSGVGATWDKYVQGGNSMLFEKNINELIRKVADYRAAIEGIQGLPTETYAEQEAADIFLPQKENIESVKSTFKEIINLVSEYSNIAASEWTELDARFDNIVGKLPEEAAAYLPLLYDMLEKMKVAAVSAEESGASFNFAKSIQNFQQEFIHGLANVLWEQTGDKMFDPINAKVHEELVQLVTNMDNTLRDEAAKLNLNDFQKSVVEAMEVIAQKTGQHVNAFTDFIPKIGDSLSTTREAIEAEIGLLESRVTTWTNSMKVEAPELISARPGALSETQENIDKAIKLIEMFKMLRDFLGGADKKKGRTDNTIEERIKVIDQMNKKYLELNKTLSKAESLQGAFDAYKDAFATAYGREDVRAMKVEDFVKNVLNFPNEDDIVKWFDKLEKTVSDKEDKIKVQLAKGKFVMDVQVRAKKELDEQLEKDIQDMFDQYDLAIEIKDLHIPSDLAKRLFGVEGIELEDIRKKVQDELTKAKAVKGNEDRIKQLEKDLEKIDDLEDKAREEQAKKFVKFLKRTLDETRVVLEQKGIDISFAKEQFDNGAISAETFAEVVREISKQANDDISKINFEKFKESSLYIKAMGDLAAYSKKELDNLANELSKILEKNAKNMKPDELEAYHKALERIRQETRKFNPFIGENEVSKIVEYLSLEKELTKERKKQKELEGEKARLENKRTSLVDLLDKARQQQAQGKLVDTGALENQLINTEESIGQVDSLLANSEMKISNISGQIGNIAGGAMGAIAMIDMIVQAVNDTCNAAKKTFEDIMEMADSFGVETDKGSWREASHFFEGMSNFNAEVTEGWENLKSGNLMGAIANTIGSIVGFIRDVNKWKDSNAEEFIQSQLEEVERLEEGYKRLEWAIDRALSFEAYGRVSEKQENLRKQIESTQKALAAEEGKKNTDEDRIEELRRNIKDAEEEIEELYETLRQDIIGSFEDLGDTLGNAMINALRQGEDALEAWRKSVDDIIADIVGKLLIQKFLEPRLADIVNSYYGQMMPKTAEAERKWDEYLKAKERGDQELSDKLLLEYETLLNKSMGEKPLISEEATKQFQSDLLAAGEDFRGLIPDWLIEMIKGGQGGNLSALQKGIQGITEDTAQIIEAYLNSIRGYVSEQVTHTRNIYNILKQATVSDAAAIRVRMVE